MQAIVEKMLNDFEGGVLSRRQLAATLTGLAASAAAMPSALAASSLKAITLNHVTVRVPDLQKTSKFYQEFFGMKLAQQSQNEINDAGWLAWYWSSRWLVHALKLEELCSR